jgi:hypothetical protein
MRKVILTLCLLNSVLLYSQIEDLQQNVPDKTVYNKETFKSARVVIGQSVETTPNGDLTFLISHHFGAVNTGFYEFFGLDQASTRIGVEYGINKFMSAGLGRSTYEKTFDGFVKFRALKQSKGKKTMPVSMAVFGNIAVNTLKLSDPKQKDVFDARLSYCTELILARQFGKLFSLQIAPTYIHKNLVETPEDHNDLFSIGTGVSFRISDKISLNGEYHYLLPNQVNSSTPVNSLSFDCDIKVGQHIFQLFFTNSQGNFEQAFITETTGKWADGYIYFGFNIHRYFTLKEPPVPEHK